MTLPLVQLDRLIPLGMTYSGIICEQCGQRAAAIGVFRQGFVAIRYYCGFCSPVRLDRWDIPNDFVPEVPA